MNRLEVHHIFPKARLYKRDYRKDQVNALANFCFLTKGTNLDISNRLPEEYFAEVEAKHSGALASQWIPMDPALWKIERYFEFLEARKALLAAEANKRFEELLHGDTHWLSGITAVPPTPSPAVVGGITGEAEEEELKAVNQWVEEQGLLSGHLAFDYADTETGVQKAVFDLVWPEGLQPGLTEPVAVLLNETAEVLALASAAGFRCFTTVAGFRTYVEAEILKLETV